MRILCLDVGDRRIGTALSDPLQLIASPLGIIERVNEETDLQAVSTIATQHFAGRVVVGLPVSLAGNISRQAEKVQLFTAALAGLLEVPVVPWNEGLSTVTAREIMAGNRARKKGRKPVHDDAVAAAVILQSYLDENPPVAPVPEAGV